MRGRWSGTATGRWRGSSRCSVASTRAVAGRQASLFDLKSWAALSAGASERRSSELGHRQLQSLAPDDLDRLYRDLLVGGGRTGRGLSPKTVRHVHVLLHTCLAAAVRKGHLEHNPADRADPPSVPHGRPKVWWPDDLQAFLASAQGDRLAALWTLAATTGMRRAELLGLGWDVVDLDAGRLEVRRTVVLVEGRPVLVDATKTAHGRRAFALDPATVAALKTHRTRQLAERLAWGEGWTDTGLVFTREDGSLIDPRWLTKAFTRKAMAAGLPTTRPRTPTPLSGWPR